ncbi:MAG: hypothetical protein KGY75_06925 [Candidatus Cloacimonetes bacterium]|nr:hypothetical protein [Candidatus Cloacimonadota bacterium]MBS3767834.1 hypothetical protein [Candidatus Cloacimonadota bacterium]
MKKILFLSLLLFAAVNLSAISLKQVYESAPAAGGYDKYLELETGHIYTGGLLIGKVLDPVNSELSGYEGRDVRIAGNGAILDLQGEQLCISYCENELAIDNCIIINGNIRFRGIAQPDTTSMPTGFVKYCTFYNTDDYGVRLQGAGDSITIERNIFVDAVDTGPGFIYTNGTSTPLIITGANVAISVFYNTYGIPNLLHNWSFHTEPAINADSTRHFVALCEYG